MSPLLAEPPESGRDELPDPTKCPHCGHGDIRGNGSSRGKRRFRCRDRRRTFSARTGTVRHCSHKDDRAWRQYVELMFAGLSLPGIVERMDMTLPTARAWRHRILHALRNMPGPKLSGVVEADDRCFRLSFKGQKKAMPRCPGKRGGKPEKREISKDRVCAATATDRQRGTFLQSVRLGRMPASHLRGGFEASVDWKASLLVTDGHQACAALADGDDRSHTSLKGGKGRGGIHIQTGSNLHSQLKSRIRRFSGVATKYLDHYPAFFQNRNAGPVPLLTGQAGWTSARSLRETPMALT